MCCAARQTVNVKLIMHPGFHSLALCRGEETLTEWMPNMTTSQRARGQVVGVRQTLYCGLRG